MNTTDGLIEILSDMRRINKERLDCYENVLNREQVLHVQLLSMINNKISECRRNIVALTKLTMSFGVDFGELGIIPGQIFLLWSEARKECRDNFRQSVLNECSEGEAAALEAYRAALVSEVLNHFESRKLLMDQKFLLQIFMDQLNRYRDLQVLSVQPVLYSNY